MDLAVSILKMTFLEILQVHCDKEHLTKSRRSIPEMELSLTTALQRPTPTLMTRM